MPGSRAASSTVATRTGQEVTDDQQRPPFAQDVEGPRGAAVLRVGASVGRAHEETLHLMEVHYNLEIMVQKIGS